MIRVPRDQLIEVDVGERLTLQKVDDVLVSKDDEPFRLPREMGRFSASNVAKAPHGKITEKLDSTFFDEIWKRRAIETQQEILERQLSRSHSQQNELTKTLQSIAEALKPPLPPPPEPEKAKEPPVVLSQFSPRDIINEVQGNLDAARDDFKSGMQTLAKTLAAKLDTSTTCSKREIEESLEAYMTRVQEEFRDIRLEVRSGRQQNVTPCTEHRTTYHAVEPSPPPESCTLDLILEPPQRDFYDDIRLEMDQLQNEMNSLTWAADLSKRALRPKVLNAQTNATPILKKKTEPYSGKKVAVPGENVHLASTTRQVYMSTQRPRHLKDSGRKLLELPEKIRPVRRTNAVKSLKSRPQPRVTRHRAFDHPATSSVSPPAERLQVSSSYRSPSPPYSLKHAARLSPRPRNNFADILARPLSPLERAREDKEPCRPREIRDLQLLLPPVDLFQLPINEEAPADVATTHRQVPDRDLTQKSGRGDDVTACEEEKRVDAGSAADDVSRVTPDPVARPIEKQNSMLAQILKECLPTIPKTLHAKEVQTTTLPGDVGAPEGQRRAPHTVPSAPPGDVCAEPAPVPTERKAPLGGAPAEPAPVPAVRNAPAEPAPVPAVRKAPPPPSVARYTTPMRTVGTQAQEKKQRPAAKRKHKKDTVAPPSAPIYPTYPHPACAASAPLAPPHVPVVIATPAPDVSTFVTATSRVSTTTPVVLRGHVVSHGPITARETATQISPPDANAVVPSNGASARGQGNAGDDSTIAVQTKAPHAAESGTGTLSRGRHEMDKGFATSELRRRASRFEDLMLLGPTRSLKVDVAPSLNLSESLSLDKSSLFSDGECLYSVGEIALSHMDRSEGEIASEFEFLI